MLTPPDLSVDTILATVRAIHGRQAARATFLPLGADVNCAVYRVETDESRAYFLKLRRGDFDAIAVEAPAWLHAQGILEVMAPLPTADGRLWASAHGFAWILYPFFEGSNGYEAPLADAQWVALGRSLRAVHSAVLPPSLAERMPRESNAPHWRDIVRDIDAHIASGDTRVSSDPLAHDLAAFWMTKRAEIHTMVERAEQLGHMLRAHADSGADAFVLYHYDLHPGNVLLGAHGELTIVDWDNPIFAPKERDLMLLGGGVGSTWNDPRQDALFFEGYGATERDAVALSYYHYERVVADLATFGAQIFGMQGSAQDREWGLGMLKGNFLPGKTVEIAHRKYQQVP